MLGFTLRSQADMSISIFLSTVSDEFRLYRDQLRTDLTRHNVEVKVQEDFKGLGGDTLNKLDVYIAHCDAVVHLGGEMTGSAPGEREQQALLRKYPNLPARLPTLGDALRRGHTVGGLARALPRQVAVDSEGGAFSPARAEISRQQINRARRRKRISAG
jgi:hypothetical protein